MSDKRPILTYEAQINRVLPGLIPEIREQVLADAEARIEGLVHKEQGFDNADMEYGYGRGLAESIRALAALTQPQTEKPDCDCDNREQWCGKTPCRNYHGGGAATEKVCPDCNGTMLTADADGEPTHCHCFTDGGGAATDLDPREAFVAGFMFSGEGFNGECHNMSTIESRL